MTTKDKLISAATQYDLKQSTKRGYNHYALGQYFERIDAVCLDIEAGAAPRAALLAAFNDRLLDVMLKAIGERPFSREELDNKWAYVPVARKSIPNGGAL